MSEAVYGGNEIVLRLCCGIAHDEFVEHGVVGIGEEHRFNVRVIHADVFHAVFLLIAASQLVLLDNAVHVVLHVGSYDQSVLSLAGSTTQSAEG